MDGNTRHEPDSVRIFAAPASEPEKTGLSLRRAFLFAMPGALDLIVCDEEDEQLPRAA